MALIPFSPLIIAHNVKYKGGETQIKKFAPNPPESGKRLKLGSIPSFLKVVGLIKVVSIFLGGALELPFLGM